VIPLGFALLLLLALVGLPLFVVILGITLLGGYSVGLRAPVVFVEIFDKIADNPIFMTIPLFAHAGFVLSESGAPQRLVAFSRALLGWLPGGSVIVALLVCALFTACTGASGVTIIALGGLLLPMLDKEQYPERFNLGLLTTGGSLGLLFPPSLPLIVYALIASSIAPVGVETLFLAAFVPGILLIVVLALFGGAVGLRRPKLARVPFDAARLALTAKAAAFEMPIPVLIVGGVFGGFLTVAQAASVVATYVIFVEVFVYRDLDARGLARVTVKAMVLTGGILVIIMAALAMTNLLTDQEVPRRVLDAMENYLSSKLAFLLFLNIFLLGVGCVMDIYSAILVVVPLVLPIALRFGIDPVHLGVIFLTNLEIGYSTPPVGINLFIASLRFDRPVFALYRASLPFLGLLLLSLAIITYVPTLSLGLTRAVEDTGSVTVRWSARTRVVGAGEGALRWSRRGSDSEADWERALTPPAGAPTHEFSDLRLVYRSEVGVYELSRSSDDGWQVDVRWKGDDETEPEIMRVRPVVGELRGAGLTDENWTGARVSFTKDAQDVVTGTLRALLVHFPEEDDATELVYDLELRFVCEAVRDDEQPRAPQGEVFAREIHDMRLTERRVPDAASLYTLERIRTRPYELRASWIASSFDSLRIALDDAVAEGFPATVCRTGKGIVVLEEDHDKKKRGVIRALLRASGSTIDLEIEFDLPVHVMNEE
jgi:tripartite ATP-independent transporter DctM subunit